MSPDAVAPVSNMVDERYVEQLLWWMLRIRKNIITDCCCCGRGLGGLRLRQNSTEMNNWAEQWGVEESVMLVLYLEMIFY